MATIMTVSEIYSNFMKVQERTKFKKKSDI